MNGFLLDENLPALTLPTAQAVQSVSVLDRGMSDSAIWDHARAHDLVIVTKDADFSQRIAVVRPPPRVIHLRLGNLRRKPFCDFVIRHWPTLEAMIDQHKLVSLHHDRIEALA